MLVLNKSDLVTAEQLQQLTALLRKLNRAAKVGRWAGVGKVGGC